MQIVWLIVLCKAVKHKLSPNSPQRGSSPGIFLLIPVHLVMTETEIKKSIFRTSIDDEQIALNEFRWKEGPAQNEIFSKLKVGPFLTDNMILGCKLYKNQSRLQGL